jgi:hypothetical protein
MLENCICYIRIYWATPRAQYGRKMLLNQLVGHFLNAYIFGIASFIIYIFSVVCIGTCLKVKGAPDVSEIWSFRDCRPAKQVEVSLQAGTVRVQQGGTRQRCRPYQSEQQIRGSARIQRRVL